MQDTAPAVCFLCRSQCLVYTLLAGYTACCMHTLHSAVDRGLGHKAHGGGGAGDEIVHLVALLAKPDFSLMPPRPEAPAQHTVAALQRVPALTIPLSLLLSSLEPCSPRLNLVKVTAFIDADPLATGPCSILILPTQAAPPPLGSPSSCDLGGPHAHLSL